MSADNRPGFHAERVVINDIPDFENYDYGDTGVIDEAAPELRRSTRHSGIEVFVPDTDCSGIDPISLERINPVIAIKIEGDGGHCYNITTITDSYKVNKNITPLRNHYTERDKSRIQAYIESVKPRRYGKGRKLKTKSKKSKNKRKKTKRKRTKRRTKL